MPVIEAQCASILVPRDHRHINQMGMLKPVSPNMATATPSARRAARRRRSSTPGYSSWTRSHPAPASVFPEGVARKVSASMRRAHIPDTYAASGPESGTWKDPDPRRRSSRGIRGSEWACPPGNGATRHPRPVPSQRLPGAWSQAHMPSCNRQVTSTSIHMAKEGPASAPRGHAPL
jgi:hypothetical protein